MSWYFAEPKSIQENVKDELESSNYATKADLQNWKGNDTIDLPKKTDLANFKSDPDKLDMDKCTK